MSTYRYTGSAQYVTVATTGDYDIVAFGAQGGNTGSTRGGYGAEVGGTVHLITGEKLEIVVGGQGGVVAGGGGSFVLANYGSGYVPLVIAGGGGGARDNGNGGAGLTSKGYGNGGTGQGGRIGNGNYAGAGGSGFKSNGQSDTGTGSAQGGSNRSDGYMGGASATFIGGRGGFGGGGGGENGGGGGGGYSGGAGGTSSNPGAGGGSYFVGVPNASETVAGENSGNGRIVISPNAVCFTTGTQIRTTHGECAVEDLVVGDFAVTASGETRPIVWIGHRDIDCRGRHELYPVRVAAHAFGADLPARDLWLSPGHPVLVGADEDNEGGYLVPIVCLVNGTTIARMAVDAVTYWHVELDAHDILMAEDLPAESYLDWSDRAFFIEGLDHALANPDFIAPGLAGRCRPVAVDGCVVETERQRLDAVFATRLADACAWPSDMSFDTNSGLATQCSGGGYGSSYS